MLPATQSNIVAQMSSNSNYRAAHAAVQASLHTSRNAALLELADRLVGDMSDEFAQRIGLRSDVRRVLISAEAQRHAIARRAITSSVDADLVASRIAEAFQHVRYMLVPRRDERVFELVGHAASADRWLLLALKLVPKAASASGADELWVRTAHPFGQAKFRRFSGNGTLRDLHASSAF